jgi:PhnB protein
MSQAQRKSAAEHAAEHGVHPVTPHLTCNGAADAIEFYKKAFGAEEMVRLPRPDGRLMHACIRINGSSIMLVDAFPEMNGRGPDALGGSPVSIHLTVDDADAWVERAEKAGATVTMPVAEQFWGDRFGMVTDPFGHVWSFGTPVRTLTEAELREAAAAAIAAQQG